MTTGCGVKHYEEMFSILNLMRQRRWATMFVGVVLLAGCSLSPSCFTLFAKDDQFRVKQLNKPRVERRAISPDPAPSVFWSPLFGYSPAPSSSTLQLGVTSLFLGGVVIYMVCFNHRSDPAKKRFLERMLNRLAMFECPDCNRPICLLGAQRASIVRLARNAPQLENLDETQLTRHQQIGPEIVWIEVRCVHCGKDLSFDELGLVSKPPPIWEEEERDLADREAPKVCASPLA